MKLKTLLLFLLCLLFMTTTAFAKPVIRADQQYFDINTGLYVLKGNVYIEVGNRVITAGQARVNMTSMEVWGTGGVSVTQDDIHFTGDNVYVYGTQSRATISGDVNFSRTNLKITAAQAEYNWNDKIAVFSGNVSVTQNGNSYTANTVKYNLATNSII
jgi:lipopolysaccharide export system protein LptA